MQGLAGVILLFVLAGPVQAQPASTPLPVLDVPFISQSEALCGGAAAAMVLRYWGERGLTAESFAPLVDRSAAGIRTDALIADLRRRGWMAFGIEGSGDGVERELARGRPVLALIQDRPGTFHYIVIVSATPTAIVFHDPARAPFRAMTREEFGRRWAAAERWMAVVVPGSSPDSGKPAPLPGAALPADVPAAAVDPDAAGDRCTQLVAEGVRFAQANRLDDAERVLGSALACPGVAALRELAGVRLLQKRWPEVSELAAAAVAQVPDDDYAWRLLATSRFLQNDRAAALDAWNHVGEPRLDLIAVAGLTRTRQRVVEGLLDVPIGQPLTRETLARSARRLAELPSAALSRIDYVPVAGGLAELRATVAERPLVPSSTWDLAGIGIAAAARREIGVSLGSLTGGGERIDLSWRFWPHRRRVGATLEAPAPWGGLWAVGGFAERQPFDDVTIAPARRVSARLSVSNWVASGLRVGMQAGSDRWGNTATLAHLSGLVRGATHDERVVADGEVSGWMGAQGFSSGWLSVTARSSIARDGFAFIGRTGAAVASASTPLDLWFAGDTGHARDVLLRAHPVLEDGRLQVDRLGRHLAHASGEAQHWWRGPFAIRAAAAVFVDAAIAGRRVDAGARRDVDVGIGARVAIPGLRGVLRVDAGRGLRDGATAWSFVYAPNDR